MKDSYLLDWLERNLQNPEPMIEVCIDEYGKFFFEVQGEDDRSETFDSLREVLEAAMDCEERLDE